MLFSLNELIETVPKHRFKLTELLVMIVSNPSESVLVAFTMLHTHWQETGRKEVEVQGGNRCC